MCVLCVLLSWRVEKVKGTGVYDCAFTRILIFRDTSARIRAVKIAATAEAGPFDIYAFRPNKRNAINTRRHETPPPSDGNKLQNVRASSCLHAAALCAVPTPELLRK